MAGGGGRWWGEGSWGLMFVFISKAAVKHDEYFSERLKPEGLERRGCQSTDVTPPPGRSARPRLGSAGDAAAAAPGSHCEVISASGSVGAGATSR